LGPTKGRISFFSTILTVGSPILTNGSPLITAENDSISNDANNLTDFLAPAGIGMATTSSGIPSSIIVINPLSAMPNNWF
jgi:peptide deformylase